MIELWIAGCCLLTEAFFSSAEIAILSADRAVIRKLSEQGNKGAQRLEQFLQAPHKLFATSLLGTQLSLIVSTVVVTLWLYRHFGQERAELLLIVGLSPIVVIFAETVPKALVRQRANDWAPRMAWLLHKATQILSPLVSLLSWASTRAANKLGMDQENKLISREEIEALVSHHPSETTPASSVAATDSSYSELSDVTEGERSMIAHILELSDVTVSEVMVPLSGVVAMPENTPVSTLVREINEKKYSRIPVYRERLDQVVGVVHAFDVLKSGSAALVASDIMRAPLFVPESNKVLDLLSQMQRAQQNLAVVVDEYGGAVGIISQEDILEEVVGDIEDEYDLAQNTIRKNPDGSHSLPAATSISVINQELGDCLAESDDYESIGGLLLERFTRIPKVGESLDLGDLTITVLSVSPRRIEEVRIAKKPQKNTKPIS